MTTGWNFERRRDTTARFLIGVFLLATGLPERDTSLEKVRSVMRLSPEEALFAARRLDEEMLLTFDPVGPVRSNAKGIERAATLIGAVRSKLVRFDDVLQALRAGGTPVAVIAALIRADGESLACGAPKSEPEATYRLSIVDDALVLERGRADGSFEPIPVGA